MLRPNLDRLHKVKFLFLAVTVFVLVYVSSLERYGKRGIDQTAGEVLKRLRPAAKQVEEIIENCTLWKAAPNWSQMSKAQFVLDPNVFLYPGLLYGPNNQLAQLYKAVAAAIHLNRTLVVPNFHTHFLYSHEVIPPHHRLVVERICEFVSCISLESFRNVCNGKFDVTFQGVVPKAVDYRHMLEDAGMVPESGYNLPSQTDAVIRGSHLSAAEMKSVFNSTKSCALMYGIYEATRFWIKGKTFTEIPADVKNPAEVDECSLNHAVVGSVVNLPIAVMDVAEKYVGELFGGEKYVGMHWRYNSDWNSHCTKNLTMCKLYRNVTARHVARAVYRDLKKFEARFSKQINIYIATPPSIANFGRKVLLQLQRLDQRFRGPSFDLATFVKNRFGACMEKCGWFYDDAISLIEMAVMVQSEYFYYSQMSSWSANCRYPRRVRPHVGVPVVMKYDANVYKLSEALLLEEVESNSSRQKAFEGS